jgi:hypothetical protein
MAIIINSFIDPISWKAIVSFCIEYGEIKLTDDPAILPRNHIHRHSR